MTFDQCFNYLMRFEGGYTDGTVTGDPGGPTNFGITQAVARAAGFAGDMADLPIDLAKRIYRERYWEPLQADRLPATLRYIVFDAAVNSGVRQAVKWLQRSSGAEVDGVMGPKTLAAIAAAEPAVLLGSVLGERLMFMASLPQWPKFSRGWANRIGELLGGGRHVA